MRSRRQFRLLWLALCAGIGPLSPDAKAVVTFGGAGYNDGTPQGNVGIYEGVFDGGYTATAINSDTILTATHLLPGPSNTFVFNNNTATPTTYSVQVVATLDDLALLQIAPNQSGSFAVSAPIYTGNGEVGSTIVDVGRGYNRGPAVMGGWDWGDDQGPLSWGTNTISTVATNTELGSSGSLGGDFLIYPFSDESPSDPDYNPNECISTRYDSGGGLFIDVNGAYELAGTNTAVDQVYDSSGNPVLASLYDEQGYYNLDSQGNPVLITTATPENSYATRISSKQNFIGLADGAISAANAAANPINDDGLLTLYSSMTTGAITGGTQVVVGYEGTVATLKIASNSGQSQITSLTLGFGSVLDITNNSLIIDYSGESDPISTIAAMIAAGYNGGKWNGLGIISSTAQSDSAQYGIGYADSADPGNPAGLSSGQVEIMYTLLGDANLDGKVNGADFTIVAANFNKSVTDGWDQGDFNYDGEVNGADFTLLASNFNQGIMQSAVDADDLTALDDFEAANGILNPNLPEPMASATTIVAGLGFLGLRNRKSA